MRIKERLKEALKGMGRPVKPYSFLYDKKRDDIKCKTLFSLIDKEGINPLFIFGFDEEPALSKVIPASELREKLLEAVDLEDRELQILKEIKPLSASEEEFKKLAEAKGVNLSRLSPFELFALWRIL